MHKHFPQWTPERIEMVRKLAGEGLSGNQIGRALGVSRNAISGVIDRHLKKKGIDCKLLNMTPARNAILQNARQTKEENRRMRADKKIQITISREDLPPVVPARAAAIEEHLRFTPKLLPLVDLTSMACRFPVQIGDVIGGYLFCAQVKEPNSSYCEYHRKICCTDRIRTRSTAAKTIGSWPA